MSKLPGVQFVAERERPPRDPVRTDIAGFLGRTRRGPPLTSVRVEEWAGFAQAFGGLDSECPLAYSVRGYFDSGGTVAYVVRTADPTASTASVRWEVVPPLTAVRIAALALGGMPIEAEILKGEFARTAGFEVLEYDIVAVDPGSWANDARVTIEFTSQSATRRSVAVTVEIAGEPTEFWDGIPADKIAKVINSKSAYIRMVAAPQAATVGAGGASKSTVLPSGVVWELTLTGASDSDASVEMYDVAVGKLSDEPEVAMVVLPSIHEELESRFCDRLPGWVDRLGYLNDRMLLLDPPPTEGAYCRFLKSANVPAANVPVACEPAETAPCGVESLIEFANHVRRQAKSPGRQSMIAMYHPWLRVEDPIGPPARPVREIGACGHVAGLISRLDRERGAGVTPANAPLYDAVDIAHELSEDDAADIYEAGINLTRSEPGRGLIVWGGRTLAAADYPNRYLAHRRFLHRLTRMLRAVAEPLVMETNSPELWQLLVRVVMVILTDAFRGGLLQGATPEEAFRVRADESNNSRDDRESGLVRCEIDLALAVPMEFITLKVTLSELGQLEVFDP